MKTQDGVAVIIIKNFDGVDKVLMGKRIGKRGNGLWSIPGGGVEHGEALIAGAYREVKEETAFSLLWVEFTNTVEDYLKDVDEKWRTHYFVGRYLGDDEPVNVEDKKCEGWHWKTRQEVIDLEPVWKGTKEQILQVLL